MIGPFRRQAPWLALVLLVPLSGCVGMGGPAPGMVHLRVDVENSAQRNASFTLRVNGGEPLAVALPYDGTAPNVRKAFEGEVRAGDLVLLVEEVGGGGARLERTFELSRGRNWVTVDYYQNGTMDAWWSPSEPYYD